MQESVELKKDMSQAPSAGATSKGGVPLLRELEAGMGAVGRATWDFFHHLPLHGAIAGGAVGLYAASVVGVAELAAAGFCAYVAYRMSAYGETLTEAMENTVKFQKGQLSKEEIDRPVDN